MGKSILLVAAPLRSHPITPSTTRMSLIRSRAHLPGTPIFPFSTQSPRQSANANKPPLPENPSFGAASFKELGASPTVKVVIYVVIGIMGTLETITWTKFLWAKFGPEPKVEGEKTE